MGSTRWSIEARMKAHQRDNYASIVGRLILAGHRHEVEVLAEGIDERDDALRIEGDAIWSIPPDRRLNLEAPLPWSSAVKAICEDEGVLV